MFLESYQQISDKLNPETKIHETKILTPNGSFAISQDILKPPLCLFEDTKIGTDAYCREMNKPHWDQRLVSLSCCL